MKKTFILFLLLAFCVTIEAQKAFHVINTFHIKSPGRWDYIAVGPGNNRLYVSHTTQVNILDEKTGDSIGVIENTTGVHGIAFDKEQNKGFTSNGGINTVTVFDLTTNKIIVQIPAGQNPDAILYDPFSKKIITCNGRGRNLSIIDPVNNKLLDSIAVGGKPETAVVDGNGKLFVNIEDKSEILEVDMKTFTVLAHWPIGPGVEPSGLVLDKKTNRLFSGCGNKLMMVINASTGAVMDSLRIGDGCDGVGFDSKTGNVFASCGGGEGVLSSYHIKSTDKYEQICDCPTKRGARTIAVDESNHLIYLPTADFEVQAAGATGRPRMIPGTFQVLVVGQ